MRDGVTYVTLSLIDREHAEAYVKTGPRQMHCKYMLDVVRIR